MTTTRLVGHRSRLVVNGKGPRGGRRWPRRRLSCLLSTQVGPHRRPKLLQEDMLVIYLLQDMQIQAAAGRRISWGPTATTIR
jgi:hypothetical protein